MEEILSWYLSIATKYGMKEFAERVVKDVNKNNKKYEEKNSDQKLKKSELYNNIQKFNPENDQDVMIIKCKDKKERQAIHTWAKMTGLKSKKCFFDYWNISFTYTCKGCNTVYNKDDLSWHSDYGSFTGTYYGEYTKCLDCAYGDNEELYMWRTDESDEEDQGFTRKELHNAVIIRKHHNKSIKKDKVIPEEVINIIESMDEYVEITNFDIIKDNIRF